MSISPNIASGTPIQGITEPPFWDDFLEEIPFCISLQQNFTGILQELRNFVLTAQPFMDYPKYGNLYSNSWEAFPLSVFEGEFVSLAKGQLGFDLDAFVCRARSQLPVISALLAPLESQGHLRNVFVSRLLPGSEIHPHRGWTPDFLRIHMGLVCDPLCTMTVGPVTRTWHPGELLAFKDGGPYLHSVSHKGTKERIVLSVDLRMTYITQFIPMVQG